jgi:hypothetical protein
MATGFTAGTSLGSQYQYTPITFAPLLSLVPQRQAAPAAPAPTGLEATAQMPVPQYMGGQEGPGMEMPQGMPGGGFGNPQTGILDSSNVPLTLGDILGGIVNVGSMMMSPLSFGVQAMMGNLPGTAVKGMMTPVETAQPVSASLIDMATALGITPEQAAAILGGEPEGPSAEMSTVGMDAFGPGGTGGGGDVGGIGGIGDVSPGSGGASPW